MLGFPLLFLLFVAFVCFSLLPAREASEASSTSEAINSFLWLFNVLPCFTQRLLVIPCFFLLRCSASSLAFSFEWFCCVSCSQLLSLACPCLASFSFVSPYAEISSKISRFPFLTKTGYRREVKTPTHWTPRGRWI